MLKIKNYYRKDGSLKVYKYYYGTDINMIESLQNEKDEKYSQHLIDQVIDMYNNNLKKKDIINNLNISLYIVNKLITTHSHAA